MSSIAQYQRFDKDGLELVINTVTGESFATISGYARMAGLTQQAISARVNRSHNKIGTKSAEILTDKGIRTTTLIDEETISDWIVDDNPKLAKAMLKAGVRVFLHTSAGYTVQSTVTDHRLDPDWQKERKEGKRKRLTMTDATATWIERREKEQGRKFKQWEKNKIYAAHSDALNVGVYGRKAKDLRDTLGIAKNRLLRDYFSSDEIAALQTVEEAAAWFVISKDMHPAEAIAKVVELIEYSRRFADRHHEPTALKGGLPTQRSEGTGKVKQPKQLPPDNGQLRLF